MITWLMRYVAWLPLNFPKTVVVVSLILTGLAIAVLPRLYVSTDRNLLAGENNESYRRREEVNALFGTSLVAVVVVKGRMDQKEVMRAADEISDALSKHPAVIRDVFYKADLSFFERHALLFLPVEKVEKLPEIISQSSAATQIIVDADGLPQLVTGLAELMETAPAPEQGQSQDTEAAFGFFEDAFLEVERWFSDPKARDLNFADMVWSAGPSMTSSPGNDGYLTARDNQNPPLAVLFVQPTNNSQAMEVVEPLTDLIRSETAGVLKRFPGLRAAVTGMPAIVTDEMRAVKQDCLVAGFASGLGVLLVFLIAFRSFRVSLFLVIPLGVGLIWSAGLTALLYGHLTMITSYFAAVLFGIGVAFTIHIVARFHEALTEGMQNGDAVGTALTRAGPGVVAGGGTTALAFLAIAFSEFKGFAELGVIGGLGVVLILLTNLTLLPAALLLWHPGLRVVRKQAKAGAFWVHIARSRILVPLLAVLALIAGVYLVPRLNFDYAVESLLPANAESVKGMRTIEDRTDFSMNYSIALTDTLDGAEGLRQQFLKLSTVSRAESLSMFLPADQDKRLAAIKRIKASVLEPIGRAAGALSERVDHLGQVTAKSLAASFETLADTFEDLAFDAKRAGRAEADALNRLAKNARAARAAMLKSNDDDRARALEKVVFEGLLEGLTILQQALEDTGFEAEDLPEAVQRRYQSRDQKHYAVIVFPNGDIGERGFFEKHVAELLSVSKETTGHPVTHLEFTHMVLKGFKDAVILSAIAVILLILLDLRSAKGLALALLPVLMGLGWTVVIMVMTNFKFNYANLMALPILIGTGVDYGVHLAHRAKQEGSIYKAARTTGRAIALSGLTTLIGFGSLLLGNHWGVRSLGLVLVIGIFASLVAALVVIPGLVRDRT